MGFFDAFNRVMQGQPAFTPENEPQAGGNASAEPEKGTIKKGDDKTFPVVQVKKTIPRFQGDQVAIYCWVHNTFSRDVELHSLRIAGTTRSLHFHLGAGQEKEILIYKGPRFDREKDHEAWLDYKTRGEGDYFRAVFDVEYNRHNDGTFTIEDLHAKLPIRDIYG